MRLGGADIAHEPTYRIVQRGVGYVPEDREVFAGLTVAENLELAVRNGSGALDVRLRAVPRAARARRRSGPGRSRVGSSRWSRSRARS